MPLKFLGVFKTCNDEQRFPNDILIKFPSVYKFSISVYYDMHDADRSTRIWTQCAHSVHTMCIVAQNLRVKTMDREDYSMMRLD